jgi:hypothetical protein
LVDTEKLNSIECTNSIVKRFDWQKKPFPEAQKHSRPRGINSSMKFKFKTALQKPAQQSALDNRQDNAPDTGDCP